MRTIKLLSLFISFYFLPFSLFSQSANNYVKPNPNFTVGANLGYYGNGWQDSDLAGILKNAGGNTTRITLPESFLRTYGYTIRLDVFKDYVENKNFKDITVFVEGPSEVVRDKTKYGSYGSESKVFANLYQPIWNADGSINNNNYYADYIYKTVKTYGPYVRYWEVWNEPDFTNSDPSAWVNRNPTPDELVNLNAPISHYIRMLRITYEVVKKLDPDDYVTTGGIGYTSFLDAILRNTDNPDGGSVTAAYPLKGGAYFDVLSYHFYPAYSLRSWDNSIGGFKFSNYSDKAVEATLAGQAKFEEVLRKYGYGSTYPAKEFILTETNISRKASEWRYSSDEMQKNYVMKLAIISQKTQLRQIDYYTLGEGADYYSGAEYDLMGLYENLKRDVKGTEKLTAAGKGLKTLGQILAGYKYDTQLTAQLLLPTTIDGGAFKNSQGNIIYSLWAKTKIDQSEIASATFQFPSALNLLNLKRFDWDYSQTVKLLSSLAGSVQLTGSPSFFMADGSAPVITIPTQPTSPTQPTDIPASRIYINFGPTAFTSGYWNNATSPRNGLSFSGFKNDKLETTGVGLAVTSAWETWWAAANNNGLWSDALYPAGVTNTAWSVNSGQQNFKLTGLNAAATYSLSFFSSSKLDNINSKSTFIVGGQTVSIDAYNNNNKLITLNNLKPTALGELEITLSNEANGNAFLNALVVDVMVTTTGGSTPATPPLTTAKTQVKINFNGNSWNAASSGWNNFSTAPAANTSLSNLVDDQLKATPLKITLLDTWSNNGDYGFTTPDNSGIYPDNVVRTFYYDNGSTAKQIKLSGLEASKKYNFVFFGSWKGPWAKAVTTYTIGSKMVSLDPANNQTQVVRIDDITADANGDAIINIQKEAGSSYCFINSLIVEAYTPGTSTVAAADNNTNTLQSAAVEAFIAPELTPFPNPFKDKFRINLNQYVGIKTNIKIELFDLTGRLLKKQDFSMSDELALLEVNCEGMNLSVGMYLLRVSGDKVKTKSFKIMKY